MRWFRVFALTLVVVASPSMAQDAAKVVGDWSGALDVGAMKLRLILHITRADDGSLRATMDSVDQSAMGIPVDEVRFDGKTLITILGSINGSYEATLDETGSTLSGTWKQGVNALPLVLTRTEDAESLLPKRPQEPKPPFPYDSRDVTFRNGDVTLAGTLSFPKGAGPFPAVLLISGSGPQNRDEAIMGHKPFLVLADHLTRNGIAVLRFDDRGVGESTGSFADATTKDFASDAEVGVAYLKTLEEIDAKHVGLIGHSEGGIVAPMVAARSPDVTFVVLMAGVGVPIEDLLREQSRLLLKANGADDAYVAANEALAKRMFAIAKQEKDRTVRKQRLQELAQSVIDSVAASGQPLADGDKAGIERGAEMLSTRWMNYLLTYDPAPTLRRVRVPVLAINGELDLQVSPSQNLPPIKAALESGGNHDVTTLELPMLNHLFQTATTGNPAEYGTIEETISPAALKVITDWIVARTAPRN